MSVDLEKLQARFELLVQERQPWLSTWKSLAEHYLPTGYRDPDDSQAHRRKDLLNPNIVDSTGVYALRTLAAGMQGGMTSPARPWFALRLEGVADDELDMDARAWIDEVVERMRVILHVSNFYGVAYQAYAQLGAFGTACITEQADMNGFSFECLQAGTYCLDINNKGRVDTMMRKIWMTPRQLVQEFGKSKVPDAVKVAYETKLATDRFPVLHAIYPRNDWDVKPETIDGTKRPWASVYWMSGEGTNALTLLREDGFDSCPFFGVRWSVESGDIYGTSPAMDTLPDCRMLQQMGKTTVTAVHKMVDPPVNVPAELEGVGIDLTPGGINYMSANVAQGMGVTPVMAVTPDVNDARAMIQQVQMQIKEGLYNDLFRMLIGDDRRQITATEIDAKESEKLILIGPVLERLHDEFFIPLIDRTFSLMEKHDALPMPPDSLQGQHLKVEFVSTLAQAQKLVSTGSLQQLLLFVGQVAQMDPSALDAVDTDVLIDKYSEYAGADAAVLRPQRDRDDMRQQRAEAQAAAQQQMAQQQAVNDVPKAVQALGNTPVESDQPSALDALLGGIGGM